MSAADVNATTEGTAQAAGAQANAEQAGDVEAAPRKSTYANGKPYDELLCTICGLTSCWQSPKNVAAATKQA